MFSTSDGIHSVGVLSSLFPYKNNSKILLGMHNDIGLVLKGRNSNHTNWCIHLNHAQVYLIVGV